MLRTLGRCDKTGRWLIWTPNVDVASRCGLVSSSAQIVREYWPELHLRAVTPHQEEGQRWQLLILVKCDRIMDSTLPFKWTREDMGWQTYYIYISPRVVFTLHRLHHPANRFDLVVIKWIYERAYDSLLVECYLLDERRFVSSFLFTKRKYEISNIHAFSVNWLNTFTHSLTLTPSQMYFTFIFRSYRLLILSIKKWKMSEKKKFNENKRDAVKPANKNRS